MLRVGVILIVLGFGSVGLSEFTGGQFAVWAEPMQPWLGAAVGIVGVALAAFAFVQSRNKAEPAASHPEEAAQPGRVT